MHIFKIFTSGLFLNPRFENFWIRTCNTLKLFIINKDMKYQVTQYISNIFKTFTFLWKMIFWKFFLKKKDITKTVWSHYCRGIKLFNFEVVTDNLRNICYPSWLSCILLAFKCIMNGFHNILKILRQRILIRICEYSLQKMTSWMLILRRSKNIPG